MSIYFVQVITAFLGFTLFAALNDKDKGLKVIFLPAFFGILLGLVIFKFCRYALIDDKAKMIFDCVTTALLALSALFVFFKFKPAKMAIFFMLGVGYGLNYGSISALFPLFSGELLDTQSVISFFLMCFAMGLVLGLFFFISNLKSSLSPLALNLASLLVLVVLFLERLSHASLELMRAGTIPTHPQALSFVAKGIYASSFTSYFFIAVVCFLAFLHFLSRPNLAPKEQIGAIKRRFLQAKRDQISSNIKFSFSACTIFLAFLLYFDLHASRPPEISTPIYVEPVGDKFIFDVEPLKDNELHRYAYITDEGKEVRFFLLNRFADRISPIIVFDACAICGDMGYVKRGADLICIACNVRIFLPSVGKEGGCNPIPMPFSFDGKQISVSYDTIVGGSNFFSKVVEKTVIDPVSRKKISNQGTRSYLYYGRTYFFENNETQAKFEANPEIYVDTNGTLK